MDIHQLIAAINPDVFCAPTVRREVRRILREALQRQDSLAYLSAAAKAQLPEPNWIVLEHLEQESPFRLPAFKSPLERHTLVYDSFEQSLEAFYFWLLDELQNDGWTASKLVDTFAAAPGSGLFSEMSRRETRAQQEALHLLRETHMLAHHILRTAVEPSKVINPEKSTDSSTHSRSEAELSLLRSKVETLKLYARWLGPYLRQARQMEQTAKGGAGLVSVFNTAIVELTLLAERQYPVAEDVDQGELPKMFLKARRRTYCPILIIEWKLRAAPERVSSGAHAYRGRFELTLTSCALNEDELTVLREEIDQDNLGEVLGAVSGKKGMALNELLRQIEALVAVPPKHDSKPDDPNPFTALFGWGETFGQQASDDAGTHGNHARPIRRDSDIEQVIRSQVLLDARRRCREFYNRCKLALKMACF